ncbi:MAG: dihydrolipoamide dehydrogenase, partial [Thermoplasmata archaeon]|nr:dihydrolipoamide dehydrogenase [Thermoplasmata archaeon]
TFYPLARAQVIHPALSEVVVRAFGNLQHPAGAPGEHGHSGQGHDHGSGHGEGHEGPKRDRGHKHDHGH